MIRLLSPEIEDRLRRLSRRLTAPVSTVAERCFITCDEQIRWPPIFIFGPARSGTTLVYQCVVHRFMVCYIFNLMAFFRGCPKLTAKLASPFGACNAAPSFESWYGKARGWNAPNQGNRIWSRWFRGMGPGAPLTECAKRKMRTLVAFMEREFGLPFVTKWPSFSVYLGLLFEAFPEAVFVRVQRETLQTAQSVLKGRWDMKGDRTATISRLPSSYSGFANASPVEQVCAYVLGVEQDIDTAVRHIGQEKFLSIPYEQFCEEPQASMERIGDWYARLTGVRLPHRGRIPARFECSVGQKMSDADYTALKTYLPAVREKLDQGNPPPGKHSRAEAGLGTNAGTPAD